jgi:large subunit ribosomal protein L14e
MVHFKRFVEPGRLALITYGPDAGKMCTIVDIIDQRRVIVDGPTTDVKRQQMPVRWISLTDFTSAIQRGTRTGLVKKIVEKSDALTKWSQTSWAKKIAAREARKSLGDFDRFKAMVLKKRKAHRVRTEINKLKRK